MIATTKLGSSGRFTFSSSLAHKFVLAAVAVAALAAAPALRAQDFPGDEDYAPTGGPQAPPAPQGSYAQQPLNPTDLTQLVAPIALYPDTLIAQILAASTYPAQVSAAAQWVQSMGNAPAQQIAAGADTHSDWDPSVKALTAFPQVLSWMSQNMQWTSALGNAYYNQPQDVMQTVQVMRQRAQDAGTLQSTDQQQVYEDQGAISIAPADPDVVYVPTYDPWLVYGSPIDPYPGFAYYGPTWGGYFGFGPAIYLNAWSGWGWGWRGWGLDWWGCSVRYHNNFYWTRSRYVHDWGFPHGGPRWRGGNGWNNAHNGGGWNHDGGHNGGGWNNGHNGGGWNNGGHGNNGQPGQGFQPRNPASGAIRGRDLQMPGTSRPQYPQSGAIRSGNGMQQFQGGRPAYNGGVSTPPRSGFTDRGGAMNFSNPTPAPRVGNSFPQSGARTPMNGFNGSSFGGYNAPRSTYSSPSQPRSFAPGGGQSYGGRGFSAPQAPRSPSFGGGSRPSFSGGGAAPRSFSGGGGRGFSGGGFGGGGHSFSGGGGGGGHHR